MEIRLERVKTRTATAIFAVFSPPGPMSRSDFETFGQDVARSGQYAKNSGRWRRDDPVVVRGMLICQILFGSRNTVVKIEAICCAAESSGGRSVAGTDQVS